MAMMVEEVEVEMEGGLDESLSPSPFLLLPLFLFSSFFWGRGGEGVFTFLPALLPGLTVGVSPFFNCLCFIRIFHFYSYIFLVVK